MTSDDLDAVRRLWASVEGVELAEGDNVEELRRYLARNPGLSTVAVDDSGAIVGAVLCGHDGRRGLIYHLAVASPQRGRGVGRAVMRRSLAALKAEGITRVLLLVATDNADGQAFWRREGWEDMAFAQPMGLDL
jgi:ribosomal protein S18 acetylase RimI-like enzyme